MVSESPARLKARQQAEPDLSKQILRLLLKQEVGSGGKTAGKAQIRLV